jgi:hypothetical protein
VSRNRRTIARHPVRDRLTGEQVHPYEVELPEQDMDLDRPHDSAAARAAAVEWVRQVRAERGVA